MSRGRVRRSHVLVALSLGVASLAAVESVAASNVVTGLQDDPGGVAVPTWLYLLTGGAVIGASGLLATLVTDRSFVRAIHDRAWPVELPTVSRQWLARAGGTVGLLALAAVVYVGLAGPRFANANLAVLVVFVGGRAGLTMAAYLVGNPWPVLDPWRFVAERLPNGYVAYPAGLGVIPAVAGLLVLLWVEIVLPVSEAPATLAAVVLVYSVYTIGGAVVFSPDDWFRYGDPVSVWFRCYGAVGPIQRTADGLEFRLPGSALRDPDVIRDTSGVAVVVLLVWELTFGGFVVTPPGARTIEVLVGTGLPPALAYLLVLVVGYGLFLGVYWLAARRARRRADTYLSARYLGFRFAPPLLAIAAGYHLAHYFGFALALSPSLADALSSPLSPPVPPTMLVLPEWFGLLEIGFVLAGHVLAIWIAHATSFELFSGRLQAIRSQFPFVAVMVLYTMASLWLLSLPTAPAPYVP